MAFWKIYCEEDDYPGLWQRWFQEQCVAVGWPPGNGYHLRGETKDDGWLTARKSLTRIAEKDGIVVHLKDKRLGRIGEVVRTQIEDADWSELVPRSTSLPFGEVGRRILVRWDLTVGPSDRDQVVLLPDDIRLGQYVILGAIRELKPEMFKTLEQAMWQPERWIGLLSHFEYERSLSDYIAAYPHRLEDGLRPYPSKEVREKIFRDRSRSDVLLLDRGNAPVIVECKQGAPTPDHIRQLVGYLHNLQKEAPEQPSPRGILIHRGARKLSTEMRNEIQSSGFEIEILQYELSVGFSPCQ